jgi:FtsP/CotA-like multicopper oxidase with cupredoxin domain
MCKKWFFDHIHENGMLWRKEVRFNPITETEKENITMEPKKRNSRKGCRPGGLIGGCLLLPLVILFVAGGVIGWEIWSTRLPARINMGTAGNMTMPMDHSNMPMPSGMGTPVTNLQVSQSTGQQVKRFTLTTKAVRLDVGGGKTVDAWTYNGTAPGPTLRVQQGDLVEVTLTNTLPEGVTIHWHGVAVPNSADGVAGVTQNAVKQGETYVYRFVAKDAGTYWYHSHQQSNEQVKRGLFGMLIIDPKTPSEHDDVNVGVTLHDWKDIKLTFNDTTGITHIAAKTGDWVRLRLLNTDNDQRRVTLIGAPFQVVALDGHDLNRPQELREAILTIGAGQRYDLRFHMPEHGAVRLVETEKNGDVTKGPSVVVGEGDAPVKLTQLPPPLFDFTQYGQPRPDPITPASHFDNVAMMRLGKYFGFYNGSLATVYTINGKAFPDISPIVVKEGQLVKIQIINESDDTHPIHLHGHSFTVLSKNGKALTGSPIYLDTLNVQENETYEIAFVANNPGLWMDHCHDLEHAAHGMDMMVVYPNISTPFDMGSDSGNIPE